MDLTTLLGVAFSIFTILGAFFFIGIPINALYNPSAIFIILIGTLAAVLNSISSNEGKKILSLLKVIFLNENYDNVVTINLIVKLAELVRRQGVLALEDNINKIYDPFFRRGLELLIIGKKSEFIEKTMLGEIDCLEVRHRSGTMIFAHAGNYAPIIGLLGSVVGLMGAVGNMTSKELIVYAISTSFMSTIYGMFFGYVIFHPFANKLISKSNNEVTNKRIIVEGILLLEQGLHPSQVKENLVCFLTSKECKPFGITEERE